jgi:cell division septation protein DedD
VKINYHRQTQFELFPGAPQHPVKRSKTPFLKTRLSLSMENIGILGVLMVISMVASFSIGVERGNRTARPAANAVVRTAAVRAVVPQEPKVQQTLPAPVKPRTDRAEKRPPEQPEFEIVRASMPLPGVVSEPVARLDSPADEKAKMYTVQVASFQLDKYAQKEAKTLKKKGYDIFVIPKGKHSIVCVGRFSQRQEAQEFSSKLRKKYKDCIIRSL